MKKLSYLVCMLALAGITACTQESQDVAVKTSGTDAVLNPGAQPGTASLAVNVQHQFGSEALTLSSARRWRTPNGDSISVQALQYFISQVRLHRAGSSQVWKEDTLKSYYLVGPTSARSDFNFVVRNISPGVYDSIEFVIGVPPYANTDITYVGRGGLDINSGMAWDWATGWKFILMEGRYKASNGATGDLVWHTGLNPALRKVKWALGSAGLSFGSGSERGLNIRAQVDRGFNSPNTLALPASENSMTDLSLIAPISDNWAQGVLSLVSTR